MKSALAQSEGRISREITAMRENLLNIIAHIEATVDFPEEDLEEVTSQQVKIDLKNLIDHIDKLAASANEGKILREGIDLVIIGKPNVGKSSLLNALLMENRAIVTDVPGTTRDIIEEYINIDGIPLKVVDTAGIRETEDLVEKIGVEKSKKKINEADLIILMLDASRELDSEDKEIIQYMKDRRYLLLLNKTDLDKKLNINEIDQLNKDFIIEVSALKGMGIDKLKDAIKRMFFKGEITANDIMITNSRHKEALIRAKENVKKP